MKTIRAKFQVDSIEQDGDNSSVKLSAVASDDPKDNTYAEATPSGNLSISVSKAGAKTFFKEGEAYYLDFTKAETEG